jgi:hypothetical protein
MPPAEFSRVITRRIGVKAGQDVAALIEAGAARPTEPLSSALPRAAEMFSASIGHSVPKMQHELLGPALEHWGTRTVGDLTVAELNSWYESLHAPTQGTKIKFIELQRLNDLFWMALAIGRVETQVAETVEFASLHLVPAWTAGNSGSAGAVAGGAGGIGFALANVAGRAMGKRGSEESVAKTLPNVGVSGLWVTATRVALVASHGLVPVVWTVDRAEIAGVHKSLRTQVLTRFSLLFTDSSKATFMVSSKTAVVILQDALGKS